MGLTGDGGVERKAILAGRERYHDLLEAAFAFLASDPFAARERLEITPPVRVHPAGADLIVYTLNAAGDVFTLRVRHGHEDWS